MSFHIGRFEDFSSAPVIEGEFVFLAIRDCLLELGPDPRISGEVPEAVAGRVRQINADAEKEAELMNGCGG